MDLVLIVTLIILHHVTSFLCKPLSERSSEVFENAAIGDLLKDINTQITKIDGSGQPKGGMKVVHVMRLIHKDGIKGPLAIFMAPPKPASDIVNVNGINLFENKQMNDVADNRRESHERANEISTENHLNESQEEFITGPDKVILVNYTTEQAKVEQEKLNQTIQDIVINENESDETTTDMTTEKTLETTEDNDNHYDSFPVSNHIKIVTNEKDSRDSLHENQLDNLIYNHSFKSNETVENNEDIKTKVLQEQFKDINFENKSESVEDVFANDKESIKENSDPKPEIIPLATNKTKQNTVSDILLQVILNTNDLICKIDDTGHPAIFLNGYNIKDVKTRYKNNKENKSKEDTRSYHLMFVFSR